MMRQRIRQNHIGSATLSREVNISLRWSNKITMHRFSNAAYNDDEVNDHTEKSRELHSIGEMHSTEERLEELVLHTTVKNLDLSTLDTKRCNYIESKNDIERFEGTNKDIINIKIGSLEPSISMRDEHDKREFFCKIQATLENSSAEESKNETASHALLNYFAMLGQPDETDEFDYYFVEALCQKADINIKDIHRQTLMHEVAREWNTNVAHYLQTRGIHIDDEDALGRTPLFVAVAANNIEMITWLINNGANINHRTVSGEGQYPIHYAAKYDAVEATDLLIKVGASPVERDEQARTPFFVAAEAGHHRICSHFLDMEIPAASYAMTDVSTIDEIIKNLPTGLAERALYQFYGVANDNISKVHVYLSPLGKKRSRMLNRKQEISTLNSVIPPTALELIARREYLELISHPVIQQLIKIKSTQFGDKYIRLDIALHITFTLLWTIAAAVRVADIDESWRHPTTNEMVTVLSVTLIAQLFTFFFIYKLYKEWLAKRQYVEDEKKLHKIQHFRNEKFCHPRWIGDAAMLDKKKEAAHSLRVNFWQDGWVIVDALCLCLACGFTLLTILWYFFETTETHLLDHKIRIYYSAFFVLIVWIRQNKCFKSHQSFGPFVAMLGECVVAFYEIGFLFMEFFIPFGVTFWVLFGNTPVEGGTTDYIELNDLVYQLYLLAIVGDYEFNTLKLIHPNAAEVLVGVYFVAISIITINLYIALLSEAFSRVNGNASDRANLKKALFISDVERIFPETKREFEAYLNKYCSPLVMDKKDFLGDKRNDNMRAVVSNAARTVTALNFSMQKIVLNESSIKKDVLDVAEKFREFHDQYPEKKVQEVMKRFMSIMNYQAKPYVRVAKRTNDSITRYFRQLRDGGNYF